MRQPTTNTCPEIAFLIRTQGKSLSFLFGIDTRQAWELTPPGRRITLFAAYRDSLMDAHGPAVFGAHSYRTHHPARSHSLSQPTAPMHPDVCARPRSHRLRYDFCFTYPGILTCPRKNLHCAILALPRWAGSRQPVALAHSIRFAHSVYRRAARIDRKALQSIYPWHSCRHLYLAT